jgi:hypothetical protein
VSYERYRESLPRLHVYASLTYSYKEVLEAVPPIIDLRFLIRKDVPEEDMQTDL